MNGRSIRFSQWLITCLLFLAVVGKPLSSNAAPSSRPGYGSIPYSDGGTNGTTFRVWAPNASSVAVKGTFNSFSNTANPLFAEGSGVWSVDVPNALPGHAYKYRINGSFDKQDPRCRKQVASNGNSIIYNTTNFDWSGDTFTHVPLNDAVIYELNIGTFNDPNASNGHPGTFIDATNRLAYLKELGVSAVEVMPISEFPGDFSWGYNPSDLFGVESAFGVSGNGADGFKIFVKACHQLGIGVILDVLHNHYGPTDLDLWRFDGSSSGAYGGIYFYQVAGLCCTPYGDTRPNYSTPQVRSFIQDTFTMWLDEYNVDGFRWDSPGYMLNSDAGYNNDAQSLIQQCSTMIHTGYVGKINIGEDHRELSGTSGFDSTWANYVFQSSIVPQLTTASDASRDMGSISTAVNLNHTGAGANGWGNVLYMESHDSAGDLNGGQRLPFQIDTNNPTGYYARKRSTLGAALTLTSPGIPMILQGQEMLTTAQFGADEAEALNWSRTNTYSGIVSLYRDLIHLRRNLDGLSSGLKGWSGMNLALDNVNKLIAYWRWNTAASGDDVVVVANFANATRANYNINFPKGGTWYTHFNSDSTNYSSDFGNIGSTNVVAANTGSHTGAITIGPYSVLILSQVADSTPVANFIGSPTNGLAPLTVTFTNTSTGIFTNQFWNFGDGGTSIAVSPSHTYTNVGTFSVALSVYGPGGTGTLVRANMITIPSVASATWTNANASGNWSAATSWNPVSIPDFGADVIFGAAGVTSVVDSVSRTVSSVTFNRTGNFYVTASGGAGLTINNGVTVAGSFTYMIGVPLLLGGANTWSITNGGTLSVNGPVSGTNAITKFGSGTLTLSATNNYSGATIISNGTLAIRGAGLITNTPSIDIATNATLDVSGRTGASMTVVNGQILKGNGTLQGNLILVDGSTFSPGGSSVGTLTFLNDLVVSNAATLQYDLGTNSDLAAVSSNLTLGGTLNINDAGGFAVGAYTLVTYGGALTYNGVTIGTAPSGYACTIDTNTAGQVKLNVNHAPSTILADAGNLYDRFGTLAPTNSVAVLVVDTGNNGFEDPQPSSSLSLGATWGTDDKVVGLWDLTACQCGDGNLFDQTVVAYTNGIAPGQKLQLYWFPSLTLASNTVGVTYYGKYTDTNSPPLDGSDEWQMPAGGTNVHLKFWTAFWGGSNPETAGRATLLTGAAMTAFQSWQIQYFGDTNNAAAAPSADPDGDGQNNMAEFLAGTDPTNSASAFRITSVAYMNTNVLVTWTMGSNKTNALQAATGDATGSYNTNNFIDIFTATNTVGVVTNYLDLSAATNFPARFYRVRLVP